MWRAGSTALSSVGIMGKQSLHDLGIGALHAAQVPAEAVLVQLLMGLFVPEAAGVGLISSARTIVPPVSLPNSSLKSTSVTPHSAQKALRMSLTAKAYFLMVSISSAVASFSARA